MHRNSKKKIPVALLCLTHAQQYALPVLPIGVSAKMFGSDRLRAAQQHQMGSLNRQGKWAERADRNIQE
jgi:hypothetical protein